MLSVDIVDIKTNSGPFFTDPSKPFMLHIVKEIDKVLVQMREISVCQ